MEHREHVAVNADMVAKWERGVKGVSPRYRQLLCRLFGLTADQLGLKDAPGPVAVREVFCGGEESLVGMVDRAAQLLDQLGAAGSVLAPYLLHEWKDGSASRRSMLVLLDPAATDPAGHARAATATLAELEDLAERYQALYETADPAALMTSVAAHLRMTAGALGRDPDPGERRRLLGNQARAAILAGRLAADDLGNPVASRAYVGLACDSAREAGAKGLTAVAHGCAAGVAATTGMTTTALDHLAVAGRETLTVALGELRPGARRDRVLVWVDLATAEMHRGEFAAACSWATQAVTLLQQTVYALGAARLREFRAAAQRPLSGQALRVLDENLRRLAA